MNNYKEDCIYCLICTDMGCKMPVCELDFPSLAVPKCDICPKYIKKDLVQVVRCKDCKWYEIAQIKRDGTDDKRYKPSVCVRGEYSKPRKADWFCADGERREDG